MSNLSRPTRAVAVAFVLAVSACGGVAPLGPDAAAGGHGATGGASDAGGQGGSDVGSDGLGGGPDGSATLADGRCVRGAYRHAQGDSCACQPDIPDICGDACTDLLVDNDNCGACGRSCGPMSACRMGACGPAPETLYMAAPACGAIDLAVAGGRLFWAEKGTGLVSSLALDTRVRQPIATAAAAPTHVLTSGTAVYWLEGGMKIVRSAIANTSSVVVESAVPVRGFVVSADDATVYFSSGTTVSAVPVAGGAPVVVASEEQGGPPTALALFGDKLAYPVDLNGDVDVVTLVDGVVARCGVFDVNGNRAFVDCVRVAQGQGALGLDQILFVGRKVVWADGMALHFSDLDVSLNYQAVDSLEGESVTGFAATAERLYLAESISSPTPDGFIEKAPFAGNVWGTLWVRGQKNPRSLAVDATRLYWSTDDCAIRATGL